MKYCVDCKWSEKHEKDTTKLAYTPTCSHPHRRTDPLSGEARKEFCEIQRRYSHSDDLCGPGARYFEPIEREMITVTGRTSPAVKALPAPKKSGLWEKIKGFFS